MAGKRSGAAADKRSEVAVGEREERVGEKSEDQFFLFSVFLLPFFISL